MPRNTRNVWLSASIDGRSTELEGGPVSRGGGLSAVIRQREDGAISDHRLHVATLAKNDGRIVTEAWIPSYGNPCGRPSLVLETHRDRPGVTVTLDVPGLTEARSGASWSSAFLTFANPHERDAFLSLLPAWREAQAEVMA